MPALTPDEEAIVRADPDNASDIHDERVQARFARQLELAGELQEGDPRLNPVSALTIAGDMLSAERSERWVAAGMRPEVALNFVGSFARFEFMVSLNERGLLSDAFVYEHLADAWRSADPNDTDPRYLALWKRAKAANGDQHIRDGEPLPDEPTLTVYRGQDDAMPLGIAWSLDQRIAEKFAMGAGTRQSGREGMSLLVATVDRDDVLGYLTGRGESEVIVDPTVLR